MNWIQAKLSEHCDFAVVDEGPGFSGSTFLSVARALIEAGVPCSRIVLMGSRPFPVHTSAAGQAREWGRFRTFTIEYGKHTPAGAGRSLGNGAWREVLYPDRSHWPPCWMEQERIKHSSVDGEVFFKFEGFGRCGELARTQAAELAEAKFAPRLLAFEQGYGCYEFLRGRPLAQSDLSRKLLSRLASYCAFRVANFPAETCNLEMLTAMARNNLRVEFGAGFEELAPAISLERPVYPDCRMLPHEWLVAEDGRILKTDGVGHAAGHQLPGPGDIAWDLAGTIVEWNLSTPAAEFFLEEYRRLSGDPVEKRLPPYLSLYSVLRTAQCRMASASVNDRREAQYLYLQYRGYADKLKVLLHDWIPSRYSPALLAPADAEKLQ